MISVGMSNATQEFASKGNDAFKPRADSDLSKNPQLTIIDGAQEGKDAPAWLTRTRRHGPPLTSGWPWRE